MPYLLVDDRAVNGGAERALATLARGLGRDGIRTTAVLGEPGPLTGLLHAAGCPTTVPAGLEADGLFRATDAELRTGGYDVVVSMGARTHSVAGVAAAANGVPAVWWVDLTPNDRPVERAALAVPAAAIVCPTPTVAAGLLPIASSLVEVIAPGVTNFDPDLAHVGGRAVRRHLGWEHRFVVGMVARIDPCKGQDRFVRAAAILHHRHPAWRFLVVGGAVVGHEGAYPASIGALASDLGLDSALSFVGHQDDPLPWQAALDVSVSASRHEAFGLAILESMMLGVPIVATRTGGADHLLDGGLAGTLLEGDPRRDRPEDPVELANAIDRLVTDRGATAERVVAAVERARLFGQDITAARFAALVRAIRHPPVVAATS